MFEKYRLYMNMPGYGVTKRFLLFFRRKMKYLKVTRRGVHGHYDYTPLIFSTLGEAQEEMKWMNSTGMEPKRKTWHDGVLVEIYRNKGIRRCHV